MDESKLKFGDKLFLYGQYMEQERWDEYGFCNPVYNSVMGYVAFGGYLIIPQKTDQNGLCLPGFVVDYVQIYENKHAFVHSQFSAFLTPFSDKELIDVTDLLALQTPYFQGSKVWMPI